jgi:mannose-6-phosphate isomerase-like protein (cupin superfamily)
MKRHPALVPLSHDHHHALAAAHRLRAAADGDGDPRAVVSAFVDFFGAHTLAHFRAEEELIFPLVAEVDEARPLLVAILLDHQRLRALVPRLARTAEVGVMREVGELLEGHIRREERELFPLIERVAKPDLDAAGAEAPGGPVWGQASEDLNATLLDWGPGRGPSPHVNETRDVLIFVVAGSANLSVDRDDRELHAGEAVIVAKRRRRQIVAGPRGVRYLSVHLRRPPLQIER